MITAAALSETGILDDNLRWVFIESPPFEPAGLGAMDHGVHTLEDVGSSIVPRTLLLARLVTELTGP